MMLSVAASCWGRRLGNCQALKTDNAAAAIAWFRRSDAFSQWQMRGANQAWGYEQVRTKVTRKRRHRKEKRIQREKLIARGLPPKHHPPNYVPVDTPVLNGLTRQALTRQERQQEVEDFRQQAAEEMKEKIQEQARKYDEQPLLRFQFSGLQMSDRVRRLFDITNGSQAEVVKAQKQRGMELFQRRIGDTGSTAVQVIALTTRIQQLQTHLGRHRKDVRTKRTLDALYVRRRKLLDYMERKETDDYRRVVKTLGLVRSK